MLSALSVEVERYIAQVEHLRQIYTETRAVLNEVDYEHHFDPGLYGTAVWSTQQEEAFMEALNGLPRFIVLGTSTYAKAAVVNELLSCYALPAVAAEDMAEDSDKNELWRPLAVRYGPSSAYRRVWPDTPGCSLDRMEYELSNLTSKSPQQSSSPTVPNTALRRGSRQEISSDYVELSLAHPLLKDGGEIIVPSYGRASENGVLSFMLDSWNDKCLPLIIYVIAHPRLNDNDRRDIIRLRQSMPDTPVFFIKSHPYTRSDLPESERYSAAAGSFEVSSSMEESSGSWKEYSRSRVPPRSLRFVACFSAPSSDSESADGVAGTHLCSVRRELVQMGYLKERVKGATRRRMQEKVSGIGLSDLIETQTDFPKLIWFVQQVCRTRIVGLASECNKWHCALLNLFILTAFDMARDQIITPKRLYYARHKENELYNDLILATIRKQGELQVVFTQTLEKMETEVMNEAADLTLEDSEGRPFSAEHAMDQLEQFVLFRVNATISASFVSSMECLKQTFVGTLSRCLDNLEKLDLGEGDAAEKAAKKALGKLLNAAYNLDLQLPVGGSVIQLLWRKMKQAVTGAGSSLHKKSPSDVGWRRQVAHDTLFRLREIKLAKVLCTQFRMRAKAAHDAFQSAVDKLHAYHNDRLMSAETQRLRLRKQHAPKLARLTMESMAHRDSLTYGMPKLGHEIGRGQYGVVYACEKWGHFGAVAVKSVVPPDDKHWNDLALEFYYTKSLPQHERIVKLHGAVIDHNYGGGGGLPAVLLIMERMKRDLYTALRAGLSWPARILVALDVVDGMRFLHSQGLVHRDIKLKNVLMDGENRGKVTDLGFCKPEAMMSGSVVGTPIHMAPELFSGSYDSSVDVYAFGVLFWYICAGHVRLPQAFEQCLSKDQLWHSVRKGLRPEQLSSFDEDCWVIMRKCWSGDAGQRPHLGDIRPRLEMLLENYKSQAPPPAPERPSSSNDRYLYVGHRTPTGRRRMY